MVKPVRHSSDFSAVFALLELQKHRLFEHLSEKLEHLSYRTCMVAEPA